MGRFGRLPVFEEAPVSDLHFEQAWSRSQSEWDWGGLELERSAALNRHSGYVRLKCQKTARPQTVQQPAELWHVYQFVSCSVTNASSESP